MDQNNTQKEKHWLIKTILPPLITGIVVLITGFFAGPQISKEIADARLIGDLLPYLTRGNKKEEKYALYTIKIGFQGDEDKYKEFAGLIATEYASEAENRFKSNNVKGARKILRDAAYISDVVHDVAVKRLKERMSDSEISELLCYRTLPLYLETTGEPYVEYVLIEDPNCPIE